MNYLKEIDKFYSNPDPTVKKQSQDFLFSLIAPNKVQNSDSWNIPLLLIDSNVILFLIFLK